MLDFESKIPRRTLYDELGIDADGSDLIRDFLTRATNLATARLRNVKAQLQRAQREWPDYDSKVTRLQALQAHDVDFEEYRRLNEEVRKAERQILAEFPGFKSWQQERDQLEVELNALNSSPLHVPDERRKYNQAHPPLSLLSTMPYDVSRFADRRSVGEEIRRCVGAFLEDRGLQLASPSDLHRTDFENDFEYCELLDG